MINYVLNNFLGLPYFGGVNAVAIQEIAVGSSGVTPTFYCALATNKGMVFATDLANSQTTNFSFVSVPLTVAPTKVLKYSASSVYYFYYATGNTIGLYSTGSSTVTNTYALDSNIVAMDLTGTTLYVATLGMVYKFSIGASAVLTQSGIFQNNNVLSLAAIDATRVFLGFKTNGYGIYNFTGPVFTIASNAIAAAFLFREVVVNNGYIVGSEHKNIYTELISTINTGVQTVTSLQNLNVSGANTISNLTNSQSSVVALSLGNGVGNFSASSNTMTSFSRASALGNQSFSGLSCFDVTSDGVSFIVGAGLSATIVKQYEKVYTWGTGTQTSQNIYRFYQGRLKILAMFPSASTAGATVNLLDENGIPLDTWTIVSGKVTNTGVFGNNTNYCYFDAPLGLTNQSFQIQIVSSTSTEIVKIFLEEVSNT